MESYTAKPLDGCEGFTGTAAEYKAFIKAKAEAAVKAFQAAAASVNRP